MHSEADIKQGMIDLAREVRPTGKPSQIVLARMRRRQFRTRAAIAGSALAVVTLAGAFGTFSVMRQAEVGIATLAPPTPDGPFLGWDPVGDAVASTSIDEVGSAWTAGSAGSATADDRFTSVRIIFAGRDAELGRTVVAEGLNGAGKPRLGFFTSAAGSDRLILRSDREAPNPRTTKVVSLVSARVHGGMGVASSDYWGARLIAVAMPGVTLDASSSTVDQDLRDKNLSGGEAPYIVESLPISSTALTTTVIGFHGGSKVFSVPADGGAIGDAVPISADVVSKTSATVTVSVASSRIVAGQLAATSTGMVGRVSQVNHSTGKAVIDLITARACPCNAYTDIDYHAGALSANGETVVMAMAAGGEANPGNRILVPDPAQRDERVGALTIGRAKTSTRDPELIITPTADINTAEKITIMTPPQ